MLAGRPPPPGTVTPRCYNRPGDPAGRGRGAAPPPDGAPRRQLPRRASGRRSRRWSTAPAPRPRRPAHRLGQERRVLHRHPPAARPGRRRHACSSRRCSRSCATRSRRPSRLGVRAATINSDQPRRVGRDRGPGQRTARSTCCSSRPSGSTTRGSARDVLPDLVRLGRPARGRRGPLHQRLGPRLPPRLPPHPAGPRPRCRPGVPVLCTTATANDRVVGRHRRPARRRPRGHPRPARPREPAPVGARPARSRPPAWRGWPSGSPTLAGLRASSTASPSATPSGSAAGCARRASTPSPTRARATATTGSRSSGACWPTR